MPRAAKPIVPLTDAQRALVEQHRPLALKCASNYAKTVPLSVGLGTLQSGALLGLIDAVQKFQPGKGVPFAKYAATRCYGEMIEECRRLDFVPRSQRLKGCTARVNSIDTEHDTAGEIDGKPLTLLHALEDRSEPDSFRFEQRDAVLGLCRGLEKRTQLIFQLRFVEGLNQKEIADSIGLTESRVSQIMSAAILELRGRITGRGNDRRRGPSVEGGRPRDDAVRGRSDPRGRRGAQAC